MLKAIWPDGAVVPEMHWAAWRLNGLMNGGKIMSRFVTTGNRMRQALFLVDIIMKSGLG